MIGEIGRVTNNRPREEGRQTIERDRKSEKALRNRDIKITGSEKSQNIERERVKIYREVGR